MDAVTSKPTKPPESGPATEQPPTGGQWRPQVTVYRYPHPLLWIYWPSDWALATVRAKHQYTNGLVVYQVELAMPNQDGTTSRVRRSFAWGKDNVRVAEDD